MEPRAWSWVIALAAIGALTYIVGLLVFALSGCAAELPEEPGIVMLTTADAAYAGPR